MAEKLCNYGVRTGLKIRIRCIYHTVWRHRNGGSKKKGKRRKTKKREKAMENCALCGKKARMYCESDQAKLCWDCDDKVHGANFLVAKHTRVLLCRTCQSFTPWQACGPKLTPTHSLCNHCAADSHKHHQQEHGPDHHHDIRDGPDRHDEEEEEDGGDSSSDADSGYEDDDEEDEAEEEEEGENQVVPWSCASATESSPPLASSASAGCSGLAWKRRRASSFVDSDDEIGCSSSETPSGPQLPDDDSSSWSMLRPWKHPRTTQQNE